MFVFVKFCCNHFVHYVVNIDQLLREVDVMAPTFILQTQVAALQQQLKSQETVATTATNEREALASDMKTMKETRGRLEQVLSELSKADFLHELHDKSVFCDLA